MKWSKAGYVDVDAGIIMIGDPCCTLPDDASQRIEIAKNWDKFCGAINYESGISSPLGEGTSLVISTGYSDGPSPVFIKRQKGRIAAVKVVFIEEENNEDSDDTFGDKFEIPAFLRKIH